MIIMITILILFGSALFVVLKAIQIKSENKKNQSDREGAERATKTGTELTVVEEIKLFRKGDSSVLKNESNPEIEDGFNSNSRIPFKPSQRIKVQNSVSSLSALKSVKIKSNSMSKSTSVVKSNAQKLNSMIKGKGVSHD